MLAAPIIVVAAMVIVGRWRARRRAQAGWVAAGVGLPVAIVWGYLGAAPAPAPAPVDDPAIALAWAAAGVILVVLGLLTAFRGDPPLPAPSLAAPAGQPGSRSIGSIAAAIREPALVGPVRPAGARHAGRARRDRGGDPLAVATGQLPIVRLGVTSILGALIATEAYVRAWPTRGRRAFEAFSLARRVRTRPVPAPVPQRPAGLAGRRGTVAAVSHRQGTDPAEAAGGRVEVLLLAGRIDEARAMVAGMPRATPADRFEHAALVDLVEWRAGAVDPEATANLEAMERAAQAIEPVDGDERLLAEVTIATAKVRRLMADARPSVGSATQPLLEVRERLGRRADGHSAGRFDHGCSRRCSWR